MKYQDALDYTETLKESNIVGEQARVKELCLRMGAPKGPLKLIPVPSENGGSISLVYAAGILRCAGYKVGCYRPLWADEGKERIRIGQRTITRTAFAEGVELLKGISSQMEAEGMTPTAYREAEMALALWYFGKENCDIVVWDAEVPEIPEIEVLFGRLPDGKREPTHIRYGLEKQSFDYKAFKKLEITAAGKYQPEYAVRALEFVDVLVQKGWKVPESALRRGLKETQLEGSFSVLGKKPFFIAACAGDEAEARRLTESLELYFGEKRMICIVGLTEKDYESIIDLLCPHAGQIFTVTPPRSEPGEPRALPAYELAQQIAEKHPAVTAVDSLEEAVELSRLLADKEDVILAFGTLNYLVKLSKLLEKR